LPPEPEQEPAPEPELLARLKAWRTEEARRAGVPPYVVFHDRTLSAIAAARPFDREGLRQVKGIGPAKLASYGDTLLRIITTVSPEKVLTT
jgi:ATP-dependent DNA helicase RecQ